jgi:hypothetical protein
MQPGEFSGTRRGGEMDKRQIGVTLWLASLVLIVAWLTEGILHDHNFVSIYLAPIAVFGNILAVFVIKETRPMEPRQ